MRMKTTYRALVATLAVMCAAGCVRNDMDDIKHNGQEIRLWGGVAGTPGVQYGSSRGTAESTSGILDPGYDGELNIGMARVSYVGDMDIYPDFRTLGDPMPATLGRPEGGGHIRPIEFKHQAQYFPDQTNPIRYAGWYPWNESDLTNPNVDDDGSVYLSDEKKTQVTVDITGAKDVMYGDVIEGTYSEGFPTMEFNHALCLFRIKVYGMVTGLDQQGNPITATNWGKIEEITLKDLPSQVNMVLPHRCPENPPVHSTNVDEFTLEFLGTQDIPLHDPNNNIFFESPEELPLSLMDAALVSKCVAGPPQGGVLNIDIKTTTNKTLQEVSIARNFQPGHAYNIILRFSDHGLINADVTVADWKMGEDVNKEVSVDMFYDLSVYETANCYVVSSANYSYCFNGTVKGNGDGSQVGVPAENLKLNIGYLEILVDDMPLFDHDGDPNTPDVESVKLHSNQLSEGRVLFDVVGYQTYDETKEEWDKSRKILPVEGNVIIGGFDKADPETRKLLWVWHIWVTDKPQAIGCASGYLIQDRNLGATTAIPLGVTNIGQKDGEGPSHGLYYQWGRPTPLSTSSNTSIPEQYKLKLSGDQLLLDDLFPHNEFNVLYGATVDGVSAHHHAWLDHDSKYIEYHDHLWGDTGVPFQRPIKTFLDPCPPRYFVSNHSFWQDVEDYEVQYDPKKGVELNMVSQSFWLPLTNVVNDEGEYVDFHGAVVRTSTVDYKVVDGEVQSVPYHLAYVGSKNAHVTSENAFCNYAIPVRCISTTTEPVVIDLSESQTANCYMVNTPGYYKFRANVRGNGVSELWPFGGTAMLDISDGMDVNIRPAKVDLLWWQGDFTEVTDTRADIDNLMCINIMNDGKLDSEGYVMFHVEQLHAGNAILAAYDVDGEILWTWHLWMCLKQPLDIASGKRTLQDRFLGATRAPIITRNANGNGGSVQFTDYNNNPTNSNKAIWATFGFYYQWGRKDPIMGIPVGDTANENPASNTTTLRCSNYWVKDYATGEWSMKSTIPRQTQVAISESVKNPLPFYMSTTLTGKADSQWFPSSFADGRTNVALWGYAVEGYAVGQDFSKTMYDPCPPGYRTAFHDVWRLNINNTEYGYGGDDSGNGLYNWSHGENNFSGDQDWGFVTNDMPYFENGWFPYSGMRYATTGGYGRQKEYGYLNTGMPYNKFNTRTYRYMRTSNNGNGASQQICGSSNSESNGGPEGNSHSTAYGKPIRCMKE